MKPLIVGNWKMNGLLAAMGEVEAIAAAASGIAADLWIAPPATLIDRAVQTAARRILIGGQDAHMKDSGAHTGCVSAVMLADLGAGFVILGHSERRTDQHETDAEVRAKASAARRAGLQIIVCVGESEAERDAGQAEAVVSRQLEGSLPDSFVSLTIAYEPVWAIGTGRTPTPGDVAAMHGFIQACLMRRYGLEGYGNEAGAIRILYGGSVKPDNAALLLGQPNVGGALVGGASLTAASFLAIARAATG